MASTKQNSNTQSQSNQQTSTTGGSNSTTNSHTESSSHSLTQGYSDTTSSSTGGANTTTTGQSYASGIVSDNTQANFDKYGQEYQQSQNVANAYNNLQAALSGKPAFQSNYNNKLSELYDQIMNRDKFNYNFNEDAMYQLYKDQYTQQGRAAMQDTMGQAAALTGGYGSSYAQTAGQQQYQNYLQQLNNMIPELRNQAYQEYQAEGQELLNKYNITNDAYNNEYSQYRNDVADWQTDRSFNQSAYADERNFDYGQYQDNRNYWQNEYWNEKNSAQSNWSQSDQSNWNNSTSHTDSKSETNTTSVSDTTSKTNSSNWSNSNVNQWSLSNSSSNSTGSGSGSTSSVSAVQFGNSNSHNGVYTAEQRQQVVNNISSLASQAFKSGKEADEKKIFSTLQDYMKNGFTGSNGEHVQFSLEDATNVYNRAITMNAIINGQRSGDNNKSKNLGQPLSVETMAAKLGIRP